MATTTNWNIPLSDIDLGDEEVQAVTHVLRSRWLTQGAITQDFERKFAAMIGVKHAFAVSNCTVALHLAYSALGIGEGDEVILPSLTFVATANALRTCRANPVFAEVGGDDDLNLSPEDIERRITPKTKAIAVVHFAGYPCDMDAIMAIAQRHGLAVVEDCAHAPGASFGGRMVGGIGTIGCFSFFSNKNMTTGEGGMVVTSDDALADQIRLMRSHGMTTLTWDRHKGHAHTYDVVEAGYNYRLDEIRSAMGLVQLERLQANNHRRQQWVEEYREQLSRIPGVSAPFSRSVGQSAYHLMPILLDPEVDRLSFMDRMKANGIQTSIHYPPIHTFRYYRSLGSWSLPVTERICAREVTLPLYPSLSPAGVKSVVDAVARSLR